MFVIPESPTSIDLPELPKSVRPLRVSYECLSLTTLLNLLQEPSSCILIFEINYLKSFRVLNMTRYLTLCDYRGPNLD